MLGLGSNLSGGSVPRAKILPVGSNYISLDSAFLVNESGGDGSIVGLDGTPPETDAQIISSDEFIFDNETPRHKVFLAPFYFSSHLPKPLRY